MFLRHGDDRLQRRRFSRRALLLGLGQLGALGVLGSRLYQVQVLQGSGYALLADDNRMTFRAIAPERGRIFDARGIVLADNDEVFRLSVVPAFAGDLKEVLQRLAQIVPLSAEARERLVARSRRQPAALPLVVATDLSFEQVARVNVEAPYLPGVETDVSYRRRYEVNADLGSIVGFVGAVERLALDDDPVIRLPGVRIGKSGVELAMETTLRGVGGYVRQEVNARGRILRQLDRVEPKRGGDVVLTIDTRLQSDVMGRLRQERRAAAVALDIRSGEILALASVPSLDRSNVAAIDWQRLERSPDDPLLNRATQGQYPPGSTFKMVTALAALEAGVIGLRERIDCKGSYVYAKHTFRCWNRSGHGPCDLHRALRESCDTYFYEIARRIGIDAIADMAYRLGLGQTYPGIGPQATGLVPTPDWKRSRFATGWYGGETLLAGIGQGFVLATPLQLAVMTARLATGANVTPLIARPVGAAPAPPPQRLPIQASWLAAIQRAMVAVVHEKAGTGHRAAIGGITLAGKTGTSQVHRRSAERSGNLPWKLRDHSLFVAYVPAERPRYAVATVIEHAGSGGLAAAPIAREVIETLLAHERAGRERAGGFAPTRRGSG